MDDHEAGNEPWQQAGDFGERPDQEQQDQQSEYEAASWEDDGGAEPEGAPEPTGEPAEEPSEAHDATDESAADEQPPQRRRIEVGFAEGDLTVRGAGGAEIGAQIVVHTRHHEDADYPKPTQDADGVMRFSRLPDGAELVVPFASSVAIREVRGDLRAHDFAALASGWVGGDGTYSEVGELEIGRVEGDLRISGSQTARVREAQGDAGLDRIRHDATLSRVHGDLSAQSVEGLTVRESVGGDADLVACTGAITLQGSIGGDLDVRSCPGTLVVTSVGGDAQVRLSGGVRIDGSIGGDCELGEIAGDVAIRGAVGGDLNVRLAGAVRVSTVGGDAELVTVQREARIQTVGGDLTCETVAGPVQINTVGGDVTFRTGLGTLRVNMIGGDVSVQRAMGGLSVDRVGGDADLETPLTPGSEYQVRASGDINLRVRGDVNARFVAQTHGGEIRTRLPLAVERGRRRNLVGVIGRGDASVTLFSDGGDIFITADDSEEVEHDMGDEYTNTGAGTGANGSGTGTRERTWEGGFGGHKFRVRWDPGAAGSSDPDDPDGLGTPRRGFGFEWEHKPGEEGRSSEDMERQINDLRIKAEQVARRAAEQAQRYAERATRRARETDWEAVGREVRTAIERAMGDLEETFGQFRRDFDTRRSQGGQGGQGPSKSGSTAQRVRIERDDEENEGDAFATGFGPGEQGAPGDVEGQRRVILEQLRNGAISLDEAERRLSALR
jgi:DUF4097 and DUF4098 domain-containing protein YvlB